MPANKDLKRRVRARMRKTGESYTAARARLLEKRTLTTTRETVSGAASGPPAGPGAAGPLDPAAVAGMSDAAVRAKTGRSWNAWLRVLDDFGAAEKPHRDTARHLREAHELPSWWAQMVTVGYERMRGLRDCGQRRDGGYEISKSRTVRAALATLYTACAVPAHRRTWLAVSGIVVRKAAKEKSLRWTWPDASRVELLFDAKRLGKSRVVIQHVKLPTRDQAQRMKAFWGERLDALAAMVGAEEAVSGSRRRAGKSPRRHAIRA